MKFPMRCKLVSTLILYLLLIWVSHENVIAAPDETSQYEIKKQRENETTLQLLELLSNPDDVPPPEEATIPTQTISPSPTTPPTTPSGTPVNQSYQALIDFKKYVGEKTGVPLCVLEAISYIEYPSAWDYTPQQINTFLQPGTVIPNCPLNLCSASGHMQMTIGIDDRGNTSCPRCGLTSCPNAWASHGHAVKEYEGATHTPNVCNLRDSEFAAARKLKKDSGTAQNDMSWSWDEMFRAGERYYGSCSDRYRYDFNTRGYPVPVPPNLTYCEFMQFVCSL